MGGFQNTIAYFMVCAHVRLFFVLEVARTPWLHIIIYYIIWSGNRGCADFLLHGLRIFIGNKDLARVHMR